MKNSYKLGFAAIAASLALVGCGDSIKTVTGQFIDAAVEGLNYKCSSGATGTTNNKGEYTCNKGDSVTFFIGKYKLGSTTASSGIVSPYTITSYNTTAAVDVAQVLQTIESDSDGVITIPANYKALDEVTAAPGDNAFEAEIEAALTVAKGSTVTLVPEDDAKANMDESIIAAAEDAAPTETTEAALRELLEGKSLYVESWWQKWTFNADATFINWVVMDNPSDFGTYEGVTLSGTTFTIYNEPVNAEIFDKYITLTWPDGAKKYLWYNLTELEAYLLAKY